jgi:3-hydroxyisobutyrate dehydrogenase
MTRVAVLGTGIMGAPMARRIAGAGHDVCVWNRTRENAEGLGAAVAGSTADAVADAEVVITMLADGLAVEEVMRDTLASMGDDAVWAQMSTVGVRAAEQLAELAQAHDRVLVDAPVLGSRIPAEQGQLVVLAAGPDEVRERCEEVFDAVARATQWVGEGAPEGQALKLVVNSWILNSVENIAETVALAEGLGVDPRRWLDAISGGAMDMQYAHMKGELIFSGNLEPAFRLTLALKDAGLVVEAAEDAGLDLPLPRLTRDQMARAFELGHGDEDMAATYFVSAPPREPR